MKRQFMRSAIVVSAVAMLLDGGPTIAQDATVDVPAVPAPQPEPAPVAMPPVATPPASCELHIWPAERMNSMTTGLLLGGLLDAAIHAERDASNKAQMATALDSPTQLDALQALDLKVLLDQPADTVFIRHEVPLERKTMNKVKTRRSDSKASCYSELIVADVFYQKAAIYGRSLKTLFMLREFGNDQTIDFEYKAWGGNGLSLFPPKPNEDATPALNELVTVFDKNFEEYAKNARNAKALKKKS